MDETRRRASAARRDSHVITLTIRITRFTRARMGLVRGKQAVSGQRREACVALDVSIRSSENIYSYLIVLRFHWCRV